MEHTLNTCLSVPAILPPTSGGSATRAQAAVVLERFCELP